MSNNIKLKKLMIRILKKFEKQNPRPKCELFYLTPFQLVVSVVLSAQSTDKIVNECMKPMYLKGFEPYDVIKLGVRGLQHKIAKIGLYRTKAKYIYAIAQDLIYKYNSQVPKDRHKLESMLGIGRKSANVILGELYKEPCLAVDTHVFRITRRIGFHCANTPLEAEYILLQLVPKRYLPRAHYWFVLHGRYVCKAKKPRCKDCFINIMCNYYNKLDIA